MYKCKSNIIKQKKIVIKNQKIKKNQNPQTFLNESKFTFSIFGRKNQLLFWLCWSRI